jgi:hypothetical protein
MVSAFISQLNAQTLLQDLPVLKNKSISFLQSTYDRTGLNDDRISPEFKNYYDVIPQGKVNNPGGTATNKKEYVICQVQGPAVVERLWMITFPLNFDARIRFYFDGEAIPRVNKTFNELFLQQSAPFIKPLVQNLYESSGGFWSYIQMPVAQSLIVTIDTAALFGQFGVRQLPRDTVVQSWTATQNNSYLTNEFNKSGTYPKTNFALTTKDSSVVAVLPSQTVQVFSNSGSNVIEGIQLQLPQLDYMYSDFIKDKGNFHKGTSKFTMQINGNADSVLLIKRSNKCYHLDFNFRSLAENAVMKVDNLNAGTWRNTGYRTYRYWKNDTFRIPKALYQGKNQITIQAQYSSGEPWNESYYWISCNNILTDSLDVGTGSSETTHAYSVTNVQVNLYSEINNRYDAPKPVKQKNRQLLDSVYLRIYFDNETTPSISAPLGLFFATGVNDVTYMRSIPCGNINGWFYNYFSMPYWQNVKMELENKSSVPVSSAILKVLTAANPYDRKETGYLKTVLRKETKGFSDKSDYLVADVSGSGKYVGTVIEADQNNDTAFCWLEGDERIYVDDAGSPVFYGTGTEDYFNSTFYFFFDEYSLAQNGTTNSDDFYHKSMYRFHLTDPIYFEKHLRFQIEHGDFNNKLGNYQSLSFFYLQSTTCVLTDSLDVGNTNSELLHQYAASNAKIFISKNASFEGDPYLTLLSQDGYAIPDSSVFKVAIRPDNKGVRLLRTYDYSIKNQQAKVYVDDSLVGVWLNAGLNTTSQLREEYFDIPQKYTNGKSTLKIMIVNHSTSNWTELFYKVYTIVDSSVLSSVKQTVSSNLFRVFPTVTDDFVTLQDRDMRSASVRIVNAFGKVVREFTSVDFRNPLRISLSEYPSGIYFITISQEDKILKTEKVLLIH